MKSLISTSATMMIQKQKHQFGRLKPYSVKPRAWAARGWGACRAALLPLQNSLSQLQGGKTQGEETRDRECLTVSQASETLLLGQQLLVSLQGILKDQSPNCRSNPEHDSQTGGWIYPKQSSNTNWVSIPIKMWPHMMLPGDNQALGL